MDDVRQFARERRRAVIRALRRIVAAPSSAREQLGLLQQVLHESREAEAELRDARRLRALLERPDGKD